MKAQAKNKQPERRGCWLWINAKTLEGALDPLFIAFSLCVSLSAIAAGIYTIIKSNSFNFTVNSWDDFTQVGAGTQAGCSFLWDTPSPTSSPVAVFPSTQPDMS